MYLKDVKHIQLGNRKLPKTTAIFNLPSGITCPGQTKWCNKNCYAKKAEKLYPQVLPYRKKNLVLAQSNNFYSVIKDEIQCLVDNKKIDTIRVHESGDMFNQTYLNNWFQLAQSFPLITFYAYTKSFMLDFSNKPDNFILFYSTDDTTKHKDLPKGIEHYAETKDYAIPNGKEKGFTCYKTKCKFCSYCYQKDKNNIGNVVFFKH